MPRLIFLPISIIGHNIYHLLPPVARLPWKDLMTEGAASKHLLHH